jgi:hypothetical protein
MSAESPPRARIVVVGILQVSDEIEMRFLREPWGWRPDLLVNHRTEEVSQPPECFQLAPDAALQLEEAWGREIGLDL